MAHNLRRRGEDAMVWRTIWLISHTYVIIRNSYKTIKTPDYPIKLGTVHRTLALGAHYLEVESRTANRFKNTEKGGRGGRLKGLKTPTTPFTPFFPETALKVPRALAS